MRDTAQVSQLLLAGIVVGFVLPRISMPPAPPLSTSHYRIHK